MKKIFFFGFLVLTNKFFGADVHGLLQAKEWREKQIYLSERNAQKAKDFEYNIYHPTTGNKIVFDLLTIGGSDSRRLAVRFSRNKMTLGTDRAASVLEKFRFKSPVEKGEWRRFSDLAQRQIQHAIEDLKQLHVSTFQMLGENVIESAIENF